MLTTNVSRSQSSATRLNDSLSPSSSNEETSFPPSLRPRSISSESTSPPLSRSLSPVNSAAIATVQSAAQIALPAAASLNISYPPHNDLGPKDQGRLQAEMKIPYTLDISGNDIVTQFGGYLKSISSFPYMICATENTADAISNPTSKPNESLTLCVLSHEKFDLETVFKQLFPAVEQSQIPIRTSPLIGDDQKNYGSLLSFGSIHITLLFGCHDLQAGCQLIKNVTVGTHSYIVDIERGKKIATEQCPYYTTFFAMKQEPRETLILQTREANPEVRKRLEPLWRMKWECFSKNIPPVKLSELLQLLIKNRADAKSPIYQEVFDHFMQLVTSSIKNKTLTDEELKPLQTMLAQEGNLKFIQSHGNFNALASALMRLPSLLKPLKNAIFDFALVQQNEIAIPFLKEPFLQVGIDPDRKFKAFSRLSKLDFPSEYIFGEELVAMGVKLAQETVREGEKTIGRRVGFFTEFQAVLEKTMFPPDVTVIEKILTDIFALKSKIPPRLYPFLIAGIKLIGLQDPAVDPMLIALIRLSDKFDATFKREIFIPLLGEWEPPEDQSYLLLKLAAQYKLQGCIHVTNFDARLQTAIESSNQEEFDALLQECFKDKIDMDKFWELLDASFTVSAFTDRQSQLFPTIKDFIFAGASTDKLPIFLNSLPKKLQALPDINSVATAKVVLYELIEELKREPQVVRRSADQNSAGRDLVNFKLDETCQQILKEIVHSVIALDKLSSEVMSELMSLFKNKIQGITLLPLPLFKTVVEKYVINHPKDAIKDPVIIEALHQLAPTYPEKVSELVGLMLLSSPVEPILSEHFDAVMDYLKTGTPELCAAALEIYFATIHDQIQQLNGVKLERSIQPSKKMYEFLLMHLSLIDKFKLYTKIDKLVGLLIDTKPNVELIVSDSFLRSEKESSLFNKLSEFLLKIDLKQIHWVDLGEKGLLTKQLRGAANFYSSRRGANANTGLLPLVTFHSPNVNVYGKVGQPTHKRPDSLEIDFLLKILDIMQLISKSSFSSLKYFHDGLQLLDKSKETFSFMKKVPIKDVKKHKETLRQIFISFLCYSDDRSEELIYLLNKAIPDFRETLGQLTILENLKSYESDCASAAAADAGNVLSVNFIISDLTTDFLYFLFKWESVFDFISKAFNTKEVDDYIKRNHGYLNLRKFISEKILEEHPDIEYYDLVHAPIPLESESESDQPEKVVKEKKQSGIEAIKALLVSHNFFDHYIHQLYLCCPEELRSTQESLVKEQWEFLKNTSTNLSNIIQTLMGIIKKYALTDVNLDIYIEDRVKFLKNKQLAWVKHLVEEAANTLFSGEFILEVDLRRGEQSKSFIDEEKRNFISGSIAGGKKLLLDFAKQNQVDFYFDPNKFLEFQKSFKLQLDQNEKNTRKRMLV